MEDDLVKKADCLRCKHFAVTWEPKLPKACKLFGFRSAGLPSAAVYKATGRRCEGFETKEDNAQ